jgi:hypothetical protein
MLFHVRYAFIALVVSILCMPEYWHIMMGSSSFQFYNLQLRVIWLTSLPYLIPCTSSYSLVGWMPVFSITRRLTRVDSHEGSGWDSEIWSSNPTPSVSQNLPLIYSEPPLPRHLSTPQQIYISKPCSYVLLAGSATSPFIRKLSFSFI